MLGRDGKLYSCSVPVPPEAALREGEVLVKGSVRGLPPPHHERHWHTRVVKERDESETANSVNLSERLGSRSRWRECVRALRMYVRGRAAGK